VEYLGNLGPIARDRLLGGAKALLHPIFFEEPFGLSVLEAMMCGTPVIAFSRGSMPELIDDGTSGFLVNNTEEAVLAVHKLSHIDPYRCRDYAVNNFSVENMIKSYIKAYKQTIGSHY
jgi:glycosyltransferase involved in cell wall biosynthesis